MRAGKGQASGSSGGSIQALWTRVLRDTGGILGPLSVLRRSWTTSENKSADAVHLSIALARSALILCGMFPIRGGTKMMQFELKTISLGDIIQLLVFAFTVFVFMRQLRESEKQRRCDEDERKETRKIEIYQRLEIESNRVFEFEARHPELVPQMKLHLAPVRWLGDIEVKDEYGKRMDERKIAMIARKYYEMNCNLFEIAARLRIKNLIDGDVFGSWVAWYFDTCTEWGFRALWADLRDNYTKELRDIFDTLCSDLILAWDIPHMEGTLQVASVEYGSADVTSDELELRRRQFYQHMTAKYNECEFIGDWLGKIDETALSASHPLAYK